MMNEEERALTPLIPRDRIQKRVRDLASEISRDFAGKEPLFIGVLNGAVFFLCDLLREVSVSSRMDFIKASSYGTGRASSGQVHLSKDLDFDVQGKDVILVEDIVDTGLTLNRIQEWLAERRPASVRICALIDKRERRMEEVDIDYVGFQVKEGFLVGYGLDCNERYRHLPDIYTLD